MNVKTEQNSFNVIFNLNYFVPFYVVSSSYEKKKKLKQINFFKKKIKDKIQILFFTLNWPIWRGEENPERTVKMEGWRGGGGEWVKMRSETGNNREQLIKNDVTYL